MTAPQHHIEPTFSTHPTVDNFEGNMFHFCSRLAVNYDHNLLEKKQRSLLWTWPLCCSIPRQNRHSKTTLGCFTVDCFVLDPWLAAWASVLHKHPKHSVGTTRTSLLTQQNRLQRKGKQKIVGNGFLWSLRNTYIFLHLRPTSKPNVSLSNSASAEIADLGNNFKQIMIIPGSSMFFLGVCQE